MEHKYSWVILLMILALSVSQVKGQVHELSKDTISVLRPTSDKSHLQLQMAQPSLQPVMPELRLPEDSLSGVSSDKKVVDFNYYQELKYLNTQRWDSSSLFVPVYPGLGNYQNFGGTLGGFNMTNKLAFDYGAFVSVQSGYLFSSRQIVYGSNFLLHYAITDKLQFQTWGQYITPGNSFDPTLNMRIFFPTTNFGAGLQYDSNENTKIKVGIEYQYDQSDKTWKPESGGKVLLKF